jgi:Protein of unknown function (DUF3303)
MPPRSAANKRLEDIILAMLVMVIERFRVGGPAPVGERFKKCGRMLPEGVVYHASWIDASAGRCFQLMETPRLELLDEWTRCWNDLVDFEVIPVETSADFWARQNASSADRV